jgi:hypothetical protein
MAISFATQPACVSPSRDKREHLSRWTETRLVIRRGRPTLSSIGLSVQLAVRFPRCLQAGWRAAELASPLASVLCSRLTCEMEKASVRANFRQIQLRE